MEGLPRVPRIRSYVATGQYTPKSGPLAGRTFTGTPGTSQAYNAYQQARAKALGFSSYREERKARAFAKPIFKTEKEQPRFGRAGVLNAQSRTEITQHIAQFWRDGQLDVYRTNPDGSYVLDIYGNKVLDKSYGGKLDMYLRGLKRRTGTETWHPGETPK